MEINKLDNVLFCSKKTEQVSYPVSASNTNNFSPTCNMQTTIGNETATMKVW